MRTAKSILTGMKGVCLLSLAAACTFFSGCALDHAVHMSRASLFPQERKGKVEVAVEARAVYLRATPDGSGFTAESITEANSLLTTQGPIRRQVITLVPLSTAGETLAARLADVLEQAGARRPELGRYEVEGGTDSPEAAALARQQDGWDVELVSEALVTNMPDTSIAQPNMWTVHPYEAIGTLGGANEANIAMMVSDPRDLLRPRSLDPAEGNFVIGGVTRYQEDDLKDLIDINFSGDKN